MENKVRESYNKICELWYEYRNTKPVNNCIIEFVKYLPSQAKVLDVGCGTGYPIASYLDRRGFLVTGIDIAEAMIKKAKELKLSNATFLVEDILNFKSDTKFAAIIAFDSLWHIDYSQQKVIYPKVADLLEPGGLFLFTHGKKAGEIVGEMWGEKFYHSALDLVEVKKLLKDNGFEILELLENYVEETTGDRDLLIIAKYL